MADALEVLVVSGGTSAEREVSLRSGASVAAALSQAGHSVRMYDPFESPPADLAEAASGTDVVFPILHGKGGEDGTLQRELETIGVPYVGSDAAVSALCFDKAATLEKVNKAGIICPSSELVTYRALSNHAMVERPFVLKPRAEGSSIDTFLIREPATFDFTNRAVEEAFRRHGELMIEPLISGTELTVAVLGAEPLPVIGIIPSADQDFDYQNKYNGATQELCPPPHIDIKKQQEAQAIALQVHQLLGCRDLSRSDFILDASGVLYFLEINTLPGMTDQSLFPKAAAAAGIPLPQLVDRLVQGAYGRR